MSQLQTLELMRQQSRAIVLATIQEHVPISRVELAHPLVPSFTVACSLLAVLLTENRDLLPRFASTPY